MAVIPPYCLQSWNKIIKRQLFDETPERAILTYLHMQELGHFAADNYTYPILLRAVCSLGHPRLGLPLHGQTIKTGFCNHSFVQTALLNFYSHFGRVTDARTIFDQISEKDVVAWNSMLDAYASDGEMGHAEMLFDSMACKDILSYNIMVSGYARTGDMVMAEKVFDEISKRDIISWNSMILACCNAGDMKRAQDFFERSREQRNVVTWNTMLTGYIGNGYFDSAVSLFEDMIEKDNDLDHVTIASVLSAIANLGSLDKGEKIHILAIDKGLASSPHVTTALIDMYAKCGKIESSLEVFYKSIIKDIYCWNAIISGLALHGHAFAAFKLFDAMMKHHHNDNNKVRPDDITFIALLGACNHAGLVQKGIEIFNLMEKEYHIIPKSEHHGCIVSLLGRAGFLDDAFQFIETTTTMPFEASETVLGALLGACVNHRDLKVGEKVVKLLLKMKTVENLSDGEYMMIANLYASCNEWEEANRWMKKMNDEGVYKTAGFSSITVVNGGMHRFLSGDRHSYIEKSVLI